MLARVIGTVPGGVAAMICTDNQNVVGLHQLEQLWQAFIKVFKRSGITRHVAAVPVQHVEIDKVGKHDGAIARIAQCIQRRIEQSRVARGFDLLADCLLYTSDAADD